MRDLFSPKSERSPLGKRWQIKLLWTHTSATSFQKVGEGLSPLHGGSHIFLMVLLSVVSELLLSLLCSTHSWFAQEHCSIIAPDRDRKSTRLNSSHSQISYA